MQRVRSAGLYRETMFHVKHSEDASRRAPFQSQERLLGCLALAAVVCFGAASNPWLAVDCLVTGMVEEALFTGVVFGLLRRYFRGTWKAPVVTALLFALCHLAMPWKLPIAFVFSLCMIALYRHTATLAWPICAHTAFDLLWFGALALP